MRGWVKIRNHSAWQWSYGNIYYKRKFPEGSGYSSYYESENKYTKQEKRCYLICG